MQAKVCMVEAAAVLDDDIVADLPTEAVAVVIARGDLPDADVVAILQEDAAAIIAVQVIVGGAIAIEREVLDGDLFYAVARKDGKERRASGFAQLPEILAKWPIEPEAIAAVGDQRPFQDDCRASVGILGLQTDAVAERESGAVCQRNLLVEPVGIGRERRAGRRFLDKDGLVSLADQADIRAQIDRVSHAPCSGEQAHRAAAKTAQVIDGGLDYLLEEGLESDDDRACLHRRRFG